jgi:hypothetical protein
MLVGVAAVLASSAATATESASPTDELGRSRREINFAIGYGGIFSPRAVNNYVAAGARDTETVVTGWRLEVTNRRLATFEYGASVFWKGDETNGAGSYAHMLLRFGLAARWLPFGVGRFEPWLGGELGLAVADDYARWNATATERAHAVSDSRLGRAAALEAGLRGRLGHLVAVGVRGGFAYLAFAPIREVVSEPGDTQGAYFVIPTDYARRIWYTATLCAEITIPD